MEKELFVSVLFDYYSPLLTERQRDIFEMYVNKNLSLSEIAENLGISRQGVRDGLVKAEKTLIELEDKLCIHSKNQKLSFHLDKLKDIVLKVEMSEDLKEELKNLTDLIDELI